MKRCVVMLSATLCSLMISPQFAFADSASLLKIKNKMSEERLMASHISEKLAKSFGSQAPLSYATGHAFYDTPVELVDDEGHKINRKSQYNHQKHYQLVSTGATTELPFSIWFFSPNGTIPEALNDDICTFENPCQQFAQSIVNYVHGNTPNAQYWLATGTYELPVVSQKEFNPKLIELHHGESVSGRTSDFIHIPYDDDRPLILGTLAWTDYVAHAGAYAVVGNIRMRTSDNTAQLAASLYEVNIYAGEQIYLFNSDIEYLVGDGSVLNYHSANLLASSVIVSDSNLNIQGGYSSANIVSTKFLLLEDSTFKAQGFWPSNVWNHSPVGDAVFIYHSTFLLEDDVESGSSHPAIDIASADYVELNSVNINVAAKGECPTCIREQTSAIAIALKTVSSGSWASTFRIHNSNINVDTGDKGAVAIKTDALFIDLYDNKMTLKSSGNRAVGILASNLTNPQIFFYGEPSLISVSSPLLAEPFFPSSVLVSNHSTPASQCVINDGQTQDC